MARHKSHNSKYIVMTMVIIAIGYVYINPGIISLQDDTTSPLQTYSGGLDINTYRGDSDNVTTYYELKRTDDKRIDVSMWDNPNYETGDYETGVLDDMQVYNYEISKQELNYLYLTDDDKWKDDSSGWSVQWNDDGSKLYLDGSPYSCDDYDVSTCTKKGYKLSTNTPDRVVTESDIPTTSLLDYLFK